MPLILLRMIRESACARRGNRYAQDSRNVVKTLFPVLIETYKVLIIPVTDCLRRNRNIRFIVQRLRMLGMLLNARFAYVFLDCPPFGIIVLAPHFTFESIQILQMHFSQIHAFHKQKRQFAEIFTKPKPSMF